MTYVKREYAWTWNQVDDVFGSRVLANKLKWVFFALFLLLGLGFLALTVVCGLRYREVQKFLAPKERAYETGALVGKDAEGGNADSDAESDADETDWRRKKQCPICGFKASMAHR